MQNVNEAFTEHKNNLNKKVNIVANCNFIEMMMLLWIKRENPRDWICKKNEINKDI